MPEAPLNRMERAEIWGNLSEAPDIREKVRVFREMIPEQVETIVDVGCGDGAITNALGRHWSVTGVDSSREALKYVTTEAVLADARELPFADATFDLAISSQMLEHLDNATYCAALEELRRVARDYLLISVPYSENLDMRMIRCPQCGLRQHVWGHVRRFTTESLIRDLVEFDLVDVRIFGDVQDPAWPRPLLWILHNIFRGWYTTEGQHPQCARCGNSNFSDMRTFPPYLDLLKRASDRLRPMGRHPFWLTLLARRRPSGDVV
jgi:SAM-dependent methyltransferase